jgi:DNA-binding LacI/PurR family transcriptional regulator
MQVAYRGAWRNGYRRIGCAMEHVNNERVDMLWSAGYLTEQLRHRIEATIPMLLSREWSKRTFEKWFLTHQPDVVISNHLEILDWFKEMGLRVPKNVGFIDLDCMDLSGVRAGVHQNHEQVGAVAVEVLARMIQHNERGIPLVPQTIVLDGSWVEGATVRRLE